MMDTKMRRKIEDFIRFGILIVSVLLITSGIYRNEVKTVFKKAINICLECIGIG